MIGIKPSQSTVTLKMDSQLKTRDMKVAFAGDSVIQAGDSEIGFKCGRLLNDPGSITCMDKN